MIQQPYHNKYKGHTFKEKDKSSKNRDVLD